MLPSATQIKSARACLDWTRSDLADVTGLSVATIRNLEKGNISYRSSDAIRLAIEAAGWEFTDNDGICRKTNDISVLKGVNAPEFFYRRVIDTLEEKGGDLIMVVNSQQMMASVLGVALKSNLDRLKKLKSLAKIRCILLEDFTQSLPEGLAEFRSVLDSELITPVRYCIFGDKYTVILPEAGEMFQYAVFNIADHAMGHRKHFDRLWLDAMPVVHNASAQRNMSK